MYDRQDYKFDVAEAVQQLHRAAAPDSAEFIEGARLVFEVCGWAYLYCYVSRYGGGGTARRMAENVADAAAAFRRWLADAARPGKLTGAAPEADPAAMPKTTITICRKGEAGENGAC
jgi:hypothetical protein